MEEEERSIMIVNGVISVAVSPPPRQPQARRAAAFVFPLSLPSRFLSLVRRR